MLPPTMDSKVSFTIRRPTPVSRETSSGPESDAGSSFKVPKLPRHLANHSVASGSPLARSATSSPHPQPRQRGEVVDSSDDENAEEDVLITGFDSLGAQRANGERRRDNEPLVIPPLENKDWRELARKRRSAGQFVPLTASTGKDGSVGGLGTRGTINDGPVLSGLQIKKLEAISHGQVDKQETIDVEMVALNPETEDQKALRVILAESTGGTIDEGPVVDAIPTPISEADALKQDVVELPEPASLEDYTRVPVSQFGAALLRGMGWKEGTAASRKSGKGLVEPYLPAARPALLGIGAKEQEIYDDGSGKNKKTKRPDKRYIPVVKQERSGTSTPLRDGRVRSRSPRRSGAPSRGGSRSPDRIDSSDRNNEGRRSDNQERGERRNGRGRDDWDRERRREDRQRSDQSRRREGELDRLESRKERSRERRRD